jgi:uncharacterized membrane protein
MTTYYLTSVIHTQIVVYLTPDFHSTQMIITSIIITSYVGNNVLMAFTLVIHMYFHSVSHLFLIIW